MTPGTAVIALVVGCTAEPSSPPAGPSDPTPPTSSTPATPATPPSSPTAPPNIAIALEAVCPLDPGAGAGTGTSGAGDPEGDLVRITLDGARCNDGTQPIAYLRAGSPGSRDWVVFLQGNQLCWDHPSCAARWCAGRGRMSTANAAPTLRGSGLLDPGAGNAFSTYNAVFASACSSDLWSGSHLGQVLAPAPAPADAATAGATDDPWPSFTVDFDGQATVNALFAALDRGAVSDDGAVELPPLSDAERLVLAGSSAGAQAVMLLLDGIAARYPATEVVGLPDEGLYPDPTAFDVDLVAAYEASIHAHWDAHFVGTWGATSDASCLAAWASEPWRCADMWELPRFHVNTPYFLQYDLQNPANVEDYVALGATPEAYAEANARSLAALTEARPELGARGPACADHIVLMDQDGFARITVADPRGGPGWTVHDAVVAWLAGEDVAVVGAPDGSTSDCAP